MFERYTATLTNSDDEITIEASTLDRLGILVAAAREALDTPNATPRIAPEDNPDAGRNPIMTPEQMIAAHAAGTLPPAYIAPIAAVPGGAATATTAPPAPVAPSVDAKGLPWDARIHASTKVLNADGTWRARRGVDDALVAQVEAELRGIAALPAPVAPVAPVAPPAPPVVQAAPVAPVAPVAPPAPPAPMQVQAELPAIPAAVAPTTFAALCEWMNGPMLTNPPKLTLEEVQAEVQKHGLPALPALAQRPDYVPVVFAGLNAIVASRG